MQVSEILRGLADLVDQAAAAGSEESPEMAADAQCQADTDSHLVQVDVSNDDESDGTSMVSPLQQELELMKKQTGVENKVDEFAGDENEADDYDTGYDDQALHRQETGACDDDEEVDESSYDAEISAMKQMAGIGEEQAPVDHGNDIRQGAQGLNPRANAALQHNKKPHLKHTQRRDR